LRARASPCAPQLSAPSSRQPGRACACAGHARAGTAATRAARAQHPPAPARTREPARLCVWPPGLESARARADWALLGLPSSRPGSAPSSSSSSSSSSASSSLVAICAAPSVSPRENACRRLRSPTFLNLPSRQSFTVAGAVWAAPGRCAGQRAAAATGVRVQGEVQRLWRGRAWKTRREAVTREGEVERAAYACSRRWMVLLKTSAPSVRAPGSCSRRPAQLTNSPECSHEGACCLSAACPGATPARQKVAGASAAATHIPLFWPCADAAPGTGRGRRQAAAQAGPPPAAAAR